jgi:hypothetical protein
MPIDLEESLVEDVDETSASLLIGSASAGNCSTRIGGCRGCGGFCFSMVLGAIGVSLLPSGALGISFPIDCGTIAADHEELLGKKSRL